MTNRFEIRRLPEPIPGGDIHEHVTTRDALEPEVELDEDRGTDALRLPLPPLFTLTARAADPILICSIDDRSGAAADTGTQGYQGVQTGDRRSERGGRASRGTS